MHTTKTWLGKAEGYLQAARTLMNTQGENPYAVNSVGLLEELAIKSVLRYYLDSRGSQSATLHTIEDIWRQIGSQRINIPFGMDVLMWLKEKATTMTLYYNKIRNVRAYIMPRDEAEYILDIAEQMFQTASAEYNALNS